MNKIKTRIIRNKDALEMFGLSKSTFYHRIRCQLIPAPIALGGFAKGWLEHELIVILKKMIAGADNEELKATVLELLKQRKSPSILLGSC
jgi:predicted DNA-binding transcriptional regulator AlpA